MSLVGKVLESELSIEVVMGYYKECVQYSLAVLAPDIYRCYVEIHEKRAHAQLGASIMGPVVKATMTLHARQS